MVHILYQGVYRSDSPRTEYSVDPTVNSHCKALIAVKEDFIH